MVARTTLNTVETIAHAVVAMEVGLQIRDAGCGDGYYATWKTQLSAHQRRVVQEFEAAIPRIRRDVADMMEDERGT